MKSTGKSAALSITGTRIERQNIVLRDFISVLPASKLTPRSYGTIFNEAIKE